MENKKSTVIAKPVDPNYELALSRFLDGIAAAFTGTSLSTAFICEIDNTPPPYPCPSVNTARVRQHIGQGITDGAHTGAELVEAGDFSALAVWETTSYKGVPFSDRIRNVGPVREEWRTKVQALKEKYIGTSIDSNGEQQLKPCYHLGFLARNPLQKNAAKGAVSAVVKPWLERAEKEGVPVWLEATYPHAVDVYQHFGFRMVEVITIGAGRRNALGWPEEGGEGVQAYGMIYDSHMK